MMKTSNKILLTLFVLPFVIMISIYTALYGKYKNGEYVTERQIENERSALTSVDAFTTIEMNGSENMHITVKHSDSFAVRVDKQHEDRLQFQSQGGVLTIRAKDRQYYFPVTVYCPSFLRLSVDSANVEIGAVVPAAGITMHIGAEGRVTFNGPADSLTADVKRNGSIVLGNTADIKWLNLHMADGSRFTNEEGEVQQIGNLVLEDSATLHVNGKTMRMIAEKKNP